jgi:hypothetical protein
MNFLKMSKQKRNQNEQMIISVARSKICETTRFFFCKRPNWRPKRTQIKKKTAGQLGARFNACYFGQLTENTKKMKADQKTYACTSMNEEKSKKSKVILWTASKSVARGQKEKE